MNNYRQTVEAFKAAVSAGDDKAARQARESMLAQIVDLLRQRPEYRQIAAWLSDQIAVIDSLPEETQTRINTLCVHFDGQPYKRIL